jgi:hypothetical protein
MQNANTSKAAKPPMSAEQAANTNSLMTKGILVAHIVLAVIIFMFSSSILTNANSESRLGLVSDFQGLSNLKWMALISCVLALVAIGACGTLLVVAFIGEPSRIKKTLNASFEAKALRVYEFTTSATVLYVSLLGSSIAQVVLGLLMSRAGAGVPAFRVMNGRSTYRTAIKDGPAGVMVLGLVGSAATGFAMSYRSTLETAYTAAYRSPLTRAVGAVATGAQVATQAVSSGIGTLRGFLTPRSVTVPITVEPAAAV